MKRNDGKLGLPMYLLAFFATVLLGLALLAAAAFLPQQAVDAHVKDSAEIMIQEGSAPQTFDRAYTGMLDNYTDATMLIEAKTMTAEDLSSILVNPLAVFTGEAVHDLHALTQGETPERVDEYARYWMGFRAILRLMLQFLDYYQIKRYLAFVLFVMFAALICQMCKKLDERIAFAFAVSVILIRPYVVCNSLQFSNCFLVAFAAMLVTPWVAEHERFEKLFFLEAGMVTMYFDFYTTPIITWGLPLVFLYLLRCKDGRGMTAAEILKDAAAWATGYLLMWLTKMTLTTLFTPCNALESGVGALLGWLTAGDAGESSWLSDALRALKYVALAVFSDKEGLAVALPVLAICGSVVIRWIRTGRISIAGLKQNKQLLIPAALTLGWFVAASEPTRVHFWFQYRSVVLCYWAIFAWLGSGWMTLEKTKA